MHTANLEPIPDRDAEASRGDVEHDDALSSRDEPALELAEDVETRCSPLLAEG
jgi:hypothetical protein